jgi:hypothetical protein
VPSTTGSSPVDQRDRPTPSEFSGQILLHAAACLVQLTGYIDSIIGALNELSSSK